MRKVIAILCLSLLAVIVTPFGQAASANTTFTDVGSTHRAQAEIYYLVQGGITSGSSATKFSPDVQVTREQAAAMLGRSLGLNGERQNTSFPDVTVNNFSSGYIKQLVDMKIISGYQDGKFNPTRTLSRGEMAVLISRAFKYNANSVSTASSTLMKKGIAQGVADGTFGESQTIKRADFAVFLTRSINSDFRTEQKETFDVKMFVNTKDSSPLNMRTGPNTSYPTVSKLATGQEVQYGYSVGDWAYVMHGGTKGFVHTSYIQIDNPVSTEKPVEPKPPEETAPPETTPPEPTPPPVTPPTVPGKKALNELVVIIDPGHGGKDGGSAGYGISEKNVALSIGTKMNAYYAKTPIQSKMTRSGDYFVELADRTKFAAENNGDIFMSIHTNAFTGSANGTETYYYAPRTASVPNPNVQQSRALAIYTQSRMLEAWNLTDRKVKTQLFYVNRWNTLPSILAEVGFIDNKKDNDVMRTDAGQEKMAKALFLASLDYYYHFENRQDVLPLYDTVSAKPSKKLH
ncbi:N-acetylmuramoyl-L-alanine amidase [Sporosarcina sp. NPDC096371]|uniref:N-acetylmuramoyl-L-alanine amidase n=1 Tax=Sporosarcina sp. NPDC096371 TaxID=3364530 RepID=UPI00380AA0B4